MEAGGRRRDCAASLRVDSLVRFAIGCAVRTPDVRGQGDVAHAVDDILKRPLPRSQAHAAHAVRSTPQDLGFELALAESHHFPGAHLASGAHQGLPLVLAFLTSEEHLDLGVQEFAARGISLADLLRGDSLSPPQKASRENFRVIEDQQIAGLKDVRKLPEGAVLDGLRGPIEEHEARGVTLGQRVLSDQLAGQVVVEFVDAHGN